MSEDLELVGERIAEMAAHMDAAMHRLLTDLRTFDRGGGWGRQGALSCAHWLSWRVGWGLGTAREHVRVARRLGELSLIDDALRRGEISYTKVRAMTRVATSRNEAALLEEARFTMGAQLEKICRKYAVVQRHDSERDPRDDLERRYVIRRELESGMVKIEAVLHPEEASLVWNVLDVLAAQIADVSCGERATARPATGRDARPGVGARPVGMKFGASADAEDATSTADPAAPASDAIADADTDVKAGRDVEVETDVEADADAEANADAAVATAGAGAEVDVGAGAGAEVDAGAGAGADADADGGADAAAGAGAEMDAVAGAGADAAGAGAEVDSDADADADADAGAGAEAEMDAEADGADGARWWWAYTADDDLDSEACHVPSVSPSRQSSVPAGTPARARDDAPLDRAPSGSLLSGTPTSPQAPHGASSVPAGTSIEPREPAGTSAKGAAGSRGSRDRREPRRASTFDRADALVALAQHYARGVRADRAPIELVVTVPASALCRTQHDADPTQIAAMRDGTCVSAETARRLACDAGIIWLVEDDHGNPVGVSRKSRSVSGTLRRALIHRDGCCRFPGCTNRLFVEGHHLDHWANGGETRIDNALLLCTRHHMYVHEYGYTIERGEHGELRFIDRRGRVVRDSPPVIVADAGWPSLFEMNRDLEITAETPACGWDGYPVDYGLAIDELVRADGL